MSNEFMSALVDDQAEEDREKIYGVVVASVIDNIDQDGRGRVQVELPWIPDVKPWARVLSPSAGSKRGIYFIPQVGDEVLVAFNQGDINEPYVLGGLWNAQDTPPATETQDPVNKRIIQTPKGHKIELDDMEKTITLKSLSDHLITITSDKIELALAEGKGKVTLEKSGDITIEATGTLKLKGQQINLECTTGDIKCDGSLSIDGGEQCSLKATLVQIN